MLSGEFNDMHALFCHGESHGCGIESDTRRPLTRRMHLLPVALLATLLHGFSEACCDMARADDAVRQTAWKEFETAPADEPGIIVSDPTPAPPSQPERNGLVQHVWDHHTTTGSLWVGSVDALMLWRGNIPSLPIFTDSAGNVAINANNTLPGMSAGPRFFLAREVVCGHGIEGGYFRVEPFSSTVALPASGAPFTISDLGGLPAFGDIATGTVSSQSQIQSAELNWRTWNGRSINWIAGFRWVEWNEAMQIDYRFQNPNPFGTGNLNARTGNNLYGAQIGADTRLWNRGGPFKLGAVTKAGIFYNSSAYQQSSAGFTDAVGDPFPVGAVAAKADQTAFFGEVGLNASYRLTRWLDWRLGYNLFWLSGVATAPQQLAASDIAGGTALVNTNGSVLLHGVNTGLEARW